MEERRGRKDGTKEEGGKRKNSMSEQRPRGPDHRNEV